MEPPVKRRRLEESPQEWLDSDPERLQDDEWDDWEECDGEEDAERASREFKKMFEDKEIGQQLAAEKARSDSRFKKTMAHIFEKYGRDFEGIGDEVDLTTGEIVVDNGHVENMRNELDVGDPSDENELERAYDEDGMQVEGYLEDDNEDSKNLRRQDHAWPTDSLQQDQEFLEYDSEQGIVMPFHPPGLISGLYNGGDLRYAPSMGAFGASPFALGSWDELPAARERYDFPNAKGSESIWSPNYQFQDDESEPTPSIPALSSSKATTKRTGNVSARNSTSKSRLSKPGRAATAKRSASSLSKVQVVDEYGTTESRLLSPPDLGVSSETGDWTEELPEPEPSHASDPRQKVIPDSQDASDSQADTEKAIGQPYRHNQLTRKPNSQNFDPGCLLSDDESPLYSQQLISNKRTEYDTDLTDTAESSGRTGGRGVRDAGAVMGNKKRGRPRKETIAQNQPQPQAQQQKQAQLEADRSFNSVHAPATMETDSQSQTQPTTPSATSASHPKNSVLPDNQDEATAATTSPALTTRAPTSFVLPDGTVFKRKRGRPRKYALPGKPADPFASHNVPKPAPKLPREHFQQFVKRVQSLQKPGETLKRRRGRPRKTPVQFDKGFPGYLNHGAQSKSKKDGVTEAEWYRLATLLAEDIASLPGRLNTSKEDTGPQADTSISDVEQIEDESSKVIEQLPPMPDQYLDSPISSDDTGTEMQQVCGDDETYDDDEQHDYYEDGSAQEFPLPSARVENMEIADMQTPHELGSSPAETLQPIIDPAIEDDAMHMAPMFVSEEEHSSATYLATNEDETFDGNMAYPIPSSPYQQHANAVPQAPMYTPEKVSDASYQGRTPLGANILETPASAAFSDSLVDPALKAFDDYSPAPVKALPDENTHESRRSLSPEPACQEVASPVVEVQSADVAEDAAEGASCDQTGDGLGPARVENTDRTTENPGNEASLVVANESTKALVLEEPVRCIEPPSREPSTEQQKITTVEANEHQAEQPINVGEWNPTQELKDYGGTMVAQSDSEDTTELWEDMPGIHDKPQLNVDRESTDTSTRTPPLAPSADTQEPVNTVDEDEVRVVSPASARSPKSVHTTPLKQADTGIPILLKTPNNVSPLRLEPKERVVPSTPTPNGSKQPIERHVSKEQFPRRRSVSNRYKSVTAKAIPTWNLPSASKASASKESSKSKAETSRQARAPTPQGSGRPATAPKRASGGPRRSLLSLFAGKGKGKGKSYGYGDDYDEDDEDDELGGGPESVELPKTSTKKIRSFSGSKSGRDGSLHKTSTSKGSGIADIQYRTKAPRRHDSKPPARTSIAAPANGEGTKVCGVGGYRCNRDFCFTCVE